MDRGKPKILTWILEPNLILVLVLNPELALILVMVLNLELALYLTPVNLEPALTLALTKPEDLIRLVIRVLAKLEDLIRPVAPVLTLAKMGAHGGKLFN